MSSCHECFLVAGTIFSHDKMMIEKKEKETILEDTYEAAKISWSLNEKMKGH